jgi:hypothetical protein
MFSIESGDFQNNPLLFGFNIGKQIYLFLHAFDFRGPSGRQMDTNFFSPHFLGNRRDREKRSMGNATRQGRGPTMQAKILAVWWAPTSSSWVQLLQTSPPRNRLDLKPTIKRTPHAISRRGCRVRWNTQFWSKDCDDRSGDVAGAALGFSFDSIDTISFSNMMKREVRKLKNHKNTWLLILFGFVNLQVVCAWQTPWLVGDANLLFFCCRLSEEYGEWTTLSSSRVLYKPSRHPCEDTPLVASLCALSPNEWHLKNRVAAISAATK